MSKLGVVFFIVELLGTFAFALEGIMFAANKKLNTVTAVIVTAFFSFGGGLVRDVFLRVRPALLSAYADIVIVVLTILFYYMLASIGRVGLLDSHPLRQILAVFDALGTSYFVTVGVGKADCDNNGLVAKMLSGISTALLGGIIGKIIATRSPKVAACTVVDYKAIVVIHAAVYAYLYTGTLEVDMPITFTIVASCALCLCIRWAYHNPHETHKTHFYIYKTGVAHPEKIGITLTQGALFWRNVYLGKGIVSFVTFIMQGDPTHLFSPNNA